MQLITKELKTQYEHFSAAQFSPSLRSVYGWNITFNLSYLQLMCKKINGLLHSHEDHAKSIHYLYKIYLPSHIMTSFLDHYDVKFQAQF